MFIEIPEVMYAGGHFENLVNARKKKEIFSGRLCC